MDQKRILTSAILRLSPDIKQSRVGEDAIVLKHVPSKKYVIVDADQAAILERFRSPTSVSTLFPRLIIDRKCPPLRSLYELILKAVAANVLQEAGGESGDSVKALEWSYGFSLRWARLLGWTSLGMGLLFLLRAQIGFPDQWWALIAGWVLMSGLLSLGQAMAASVLRGMECEVYRPHMHWLTLFPHLKFDLDDMIMGGRIGMQTVALMRMAPVMLAALACAIFAPPAAIRDAPGGPVRALPAPGKPAHAVVARPFPANAPLHSTGFPVRPEPVLLDAA